MILSSFHWINGASNGRYILTAIDVVEEDCGFEWGVPWCKKGSVNLMTSIVQNGRSVGALDASARPRFQM